MNDINQCQNRKTKQRVSIEVCRYHIETKDRVCFKKFGDKLACPIATEILKEKQNGSDRVKGD